MIQRTFHPIGQGAFYSEQHKNFTIVYDCGSKTKSSISDLVVKNAFPENHIIDILFISHFDKDHVNKISILKKQYKIKRVILPLLHDSQKIFLLNIYRLLRINDLLLINNPKQFFGKDTDIIYVSTNMIEQIRDINTLIDGETINSGTSLKLNNNSYDWLFIPYNHKYSSRNQLLEQKLIQNGFNINKLKNDVNYTLKEIENDVGKNGKREFKKIYNSLPKDGTDTCINENSMLVYSGVDKEKFCKIKCEYGNSQFNKNDFRIGCIYTGDTDLNIVKISNVYSKYWQFVGIIQIPHHGAIKNFEKNCLTNQYYMCPISAKKSNKHHPDAKVITQIVSQNSFPILVTENSNSQFNQNINI